MNTKPTDHFENKAKNYEKEKNRVDNVSNIANLILKEIPYNKKMHVMDFGSGTGLLLAKIAPHVKKITAIDISASMNKVLLEKKDSIECELDILEMDLSKHDLNISFDNIVSSMTIHHVEDINGIFKKLYNMLNKEGTIALSDLDKEDGSFHVEDTGVYHFGFERDLFLNCAKEAGFRNLKIQTVGNVVKPYGEYPIFLLTGNK